METSKEYKEIRRFEIIGQALIGANNQREEAVILLSAIPEEYLPDIVETLQILNGIKNYICRH